MAEQELIILYYMPRRDYFYLLSLCSINIAAKDLFTF